MQNLPEGLIEKIQKIINLQEGAQAVGNDKEAEVAAGKLHHLLMQYSLDLEMVKASQIKQRANIEEINLDTSTDKRETDWVTKLYVILAETSMCKVWSEEGKVNIIGHQESVAFVSYAADQLISKIRITEKMSFNSYHKAYPDGEKRGTFRRGFFNGAVRGIHAKMYMEAGETQKAAAENPFAVMVVKKKREVDEWYWDTYMEGYRPPSDEELQKRRQQLSEEHAKMWNAMTEKEREAYTKKLNKSIGKIKYRSGPRQTQSIAGMREGYETGKKLNVNKGMDNNKASAHIN